MRRDYVVYKLCALTMRCSRRLLAQNAAELNTLGRAHLHTRRSLSGRHRCLTLSSSSGVRPALTSCSTCSCSALFCFCSTSTCRSACKRCCTSSMPTPSKIGRPLVGPYRRAWRRRSANTRITSVATPPIATSLPLSHRSVYEAGYTRVRAAEQRSRAWSRALR